MQLRETLLLLVCLGIAQGQGDFWWLGTGAFNGQTSNKGVDSEQDGKTGQNIQKANTATIRCPEGLSCLPKSQCLANSVSGIQERVSNFVTCSQGKVCCSTQTQNLSIQTISEAPTTETAQSIPFQDLPQTECPHQMECVKDHFCDKSGSISQVRVDLTQQERTFRGELIPCINAATSLFDVCCTNQKNLNKAEKLPSKTISSQIKRACPAIPSLPPVSICAGQTSSCYNVGQQDPDCGGKVCCFDGCVNICTKTQKAIKKPSKKQKQPTKINQIKQNTQQTNTVAQIPQVQCPSAMKCVPKANCNFSGVISRQTVILTPLQEEWRVPLSTCVNLRQKQIVHVCCRE